jgi:hypothetical protein
MSWSGRPISRGPYHGSASAVAATRAAASRPSLAVRPPSCRNLAVRHTTQRSGGSR